MRALQVVAWDDLDLAEGNQTPATQARLLKVGRREVELDLTDDHAKAFDEAMGIWLDLGHRPDPDTRPKPASRAAIHKPDPGSSQGHRGRGVTEQGAVWRAYADLVGHNAWASKTGQPHINNKPYWPNWLKAEAQAWVAAGRPLDWERPTS